MAALLIDPDILATEIRAAASAATSRKSSVAEATGAIMATVLAHVSLRVGGELAAMKATSGAMAEVVGHLPDRLATIEARLASLERK